MEEIVNMRTAQPELAGVSSGAREEPTSGNALPRGGRIALNFAATIAATGLVAVCAHVAVPLFFTPVPITLQTLAVLFLGLLMGPRWAFATLSLYLIEGAVGLPVFSPHGPGGVLQLSGPTGGYLLSYPFAAAMAGWGHRELKRRLIGPFHGAQFAAAFASAFTASLVILAIGAAWYGILTRQPAHIVAAQAVLPFLPGDLIKVCLAAATVTGIHRIQRAPRIEGTSDAAS